jgi:hypothetical protein
LLVSGLMCASPPEQQSQGKRHGRPRRVSIVKQNSAQAKLLNTDRTNSHYDAYTSELTRWHGAMLRLESTCLVPHKKIKRACEAHPEYPAL